VLPVSAVLVLDANIPAKQALSLRDNIVQVLLDHSPLA
jgi:hypothetical protein